MMCAGCSEKFVSLAAFDTHRTGTPSKRVCQDPETLGMVATRSGWTLPPTPETDT